MSREHVKKEDGPTMRKCYPGCMCRATHYKDDYWVRRLCEFCCCLRKTEQKELGHNSKPQNGAKEVITSFVRNTASAQQYAHHDRQYRQYRQTDRQAQAHRHTDMYLNAKTVPPVPEAAP